MKDFKGMLKSYLPENEPKIVEYIAVSGGWRKLERPMMSDELNCDICGSSQHYSVFCDPSKGEEKVRICANGYCESNTGIKFVQATYIPTTPKRTLLWPKFCEIYGIGDKHYDVRFENIQQSKEKVQFMAKFCAKPCDLVLMQGFPGTGKTYAAMGMCELFTRTSTSCIFTTQIALRDRWLEMARGGELHFVHKIKTVNFLVIDDFGTGEVSPSFLSFFMEVVNERLQWSDRGTVITTNLMNEKWGEFCGEALTDRIATGQLLRFEGISRRLKKPL